MNHTRYAIFVHEPDGDMGDAIIVGPVKRAAAAEAKARAIEAEAEGEGRYVECIVVPALPAATAARDVAKVGA